MRGEAGEADVPAGRGSYRLLGEIARGGMGVVLRGHDTDLGRDVAMKVLTKELAGREDVVQRFVEEAQIGGQLQHPGIVPVYELGRMADERPYFTMKLVKGRTLARLLADRESVEADRARLIDVFEAICQTMAYAHSRGVIHRDLKPANVMVGAFGEVQVVDWGLAKVLARAQPEEARESQASTAVTLLATVRSDGSGEGTESLVGSVLGTPAYMPPEQARGNVDKLDERSDVFALGAILCEILTGAPPYRGEREKTLSRAAQAELDDAYERLDACSADPELVAIAKRCLVAAPAARPRDAGVLAGEVRAWLEATEERARAAQVEAAEARVHAAEERKARKLTIALAASILAVLVLGGGGWIWKQRRDRAESARIDRGLEELRSRVAALQDEGRPDDALNVARNALVLVEGRASGDALRVRAEELVGRADGAFARAEASRARAERDDRLRRRLDALRLRAAEALSPVDHQELDREFAAAFREWGLDVDADLVASLDVLRASGLAAELAPAIDDRASVRRWAYGWRSFEAESMSSLAADLDPDPLRLRMREALIERDHESLLEIAALPEVDELPASSSWVLANALHDLGDLQGSLNLLVRAVERHPDDLRLRITAAAFAFDADRLEEALPHAAAAAALRSDLPAMTQLEGRILQALSRYPAGIRAHERALAHGGEEWPSRVGLGYMRYQLGDFEDALANLERASVLAGAELDIVSSFLMETSRGLVGGASAEEMRARMLAEENPYALVSYLMFALARDEPFLVDDVDVVLAVLPDPPNPDAQVARATMLAQFFVRAGLPERALEACRTALRQDTFVQPAQRIVLDASSARALAQLDRVDEARARLAGAVRDYDELVADDPGAWEESLLRRQLLRARAEVGP